VCARAPSERTSSTRGESGETPLLDLHRRLFHVVPDVVVQLKQANRREIAPLLVELFRRARDSFELFEGGLEALAAGALDPAEKEAFLSALRRRLDDAHGALVALEDAMSEHGLVWMDEELGLLLARSTDMLSRGGLTLDDEQGQYRDATSFGSGTGLEIAVSRARDVRLDRQLARRALLERVRMDDLVG